MCAVSSRGEFLQKRTALSTGQQVRVDCSTCGEALPYKYLHNPPFKCTENFLPESIKTFADS